MEGLALLLFALFGVGFGAGAFLNHPEEVPAPRLRRTLLGGWIGWTILCAVLLSLAHTKVCPAGGCIGVALWLAWVGMTMLWLIGGLCITVGVYIARNYLRKH